MDKIHYSNLACLVNAWLSSESPRLERHVNRYVNWIMQQEDIDVMLVESILEAPVQNDGAFNHAA